MKKREWRKQLGEMEKHSWGWYESYLEAAKQRDAALEREAAALNKIEELRHDNIRLATELARVRGICDADEAERRDLLAWQRQVREAVPVNGIVYTRCPVTHIGEGERRIDFLREDWDALRRAIENEPVELKGEI